MPSQKITNSDGEILRLVHTTKTTENKDDSVKPVPTGSTTIEVLVFDAIMTAPGSQFGHAAIDIDGTIYSRAHSKYAAMKRDDYLTSNQKIRDFEGIKLRLSEAEKQKIETELKFRVKANKPYSLINNSCSTNIADVLESIGILAHDPRFQLDPGSTTLVSPKELLITLSRSKRMAERIHYPKITQ